jgi:hypothetical protein
MIFCEKIELKVYVNEHDFVSNIQTPSRSLFRLCFLHELLMSFTRVFDDSTISVADVLSRNVPTCSCHHDLFYSVHLFRFSFCPTLVTKYRGSRPQEGKQFYILMK